MEKVPNTQKIRRITMKPTAITQCDIGGDWYKNEIEIEFFPDECYPDYMVVQKWIMDNIDGKRLNIEDVVDQIYKYLDETYSPSGLFIRDIVTGNKVHFDVIVEK